MYLVGKQEEKIIEAAIRMFTRYGVKRTTMNDIAREAGIARQTLYNAHANKDEILRATIRYFTNQSISAAKAESETSPGLADKLDVLFKHMVVKPFELLNTAPDADDIISGFNAAGRDEIANASEQYRRLIEELLTPHAAAIRKAGLEPAQLSDFVLRSAHGFKYNADDMKHLSALLQSLKVVVTRLAEGN